MDGEIKAIIESIQQEDNRQNKRLENVENDVKSIREIAVSIKELTTEIKYMREDIQKQGARIEKLENAPLDSLKGAKTTAISTIVSILVGAIVGAIIMMMKNGG